MTVGPVYHIFSGPRNFDKRGAGLFFSYERYSDEAVEVNLTMDNPLVIDTPAKAKALFDAVPFDTARERFHPHWWVKAVAYAKSRGHDAIDFKPSAFEGDEGWEYAASTVGEPQLVVFEPAQVSVVEAMKPEVELDDWINQWSIDKGSAVEVWGNEELRQRIRDIVDAGGDVVPILLDPEHSYFQGNEGELRAAADREVAKWAKKGYQELAFEDNMDQGELLVFKQPDWRTLKDPAKVMKAFPKRPTSDDVIDLYNVTKRLKSNQLVNFLKSVSARESALDELVNQLLESSRDRGGTHIYRGPTKYPGLGMRGSGLMLNSGDDVFLKGDDAYLVDMYWSEPRAHRAEGSAEIKVYKEDSYYLVKARQVRPR